MALLVHVALVLEESKISFATLTRVSAAVQKQILNDYVPIWGVNATVDAFQSLDDVPVGTWPIVIKDQIGTVGAEGVHQDDNGAPFALVQFDVGWSLTVSHECIEMLTDPDGNRTQPGPSPKRGQGRVEFLVEPCDPCEDANFGYAVDGVLVSDFFTPHYFDPAPSPGVKYSFTGAIKKPLQILNNGYLSWHDPVSNHWFQAVNAKGKTTVTDLGNLDKTKGSFRAQINSRTNLYGMLEPKGSQAAAIKKVGQSIDRSKRSKATALRRRIKAIAG